MQWIVLQILKYPRNIISRNASESFFPRKEGVYSQWLLDDNGIYTFCRYYPGYEQLAAVANNPSEQTARSKMCNSTTINMKQFLHLHVS